MAELAIARAEKRVQLPASLPIGPWATDKEAQKYITQWAEKPNLGGGFAATKGGGKRPANTKRGEQHVLHCHLHRKQQCTWALSIEQCVEGWAVFYIKDHTEGMPHSHALVQSPSEAMAFTAMRHIPEDLVDTAKTLREAGSLVKDVFSWLKLMTVKKGQEPLFNYMDVYHAVGPSTQERTLDATDFVAALHEREKTLGLPYFTKEDRDGCLSAAFWLLAEAREIYSQDPEHMQVLFDTKARAHSPPAFAIPLSSTIAL